MHVPPTLGDECCFKTCFLKQEEADPGPARIALAAPAHAVLSHGRVGGAPARLVVGAAAARRLLVPRAPAPRARRRQTREVQLVLHENLGFSTPSLIHSRAGGCAAR